MDKFIKQHIRLHKIQSLDRTADCSTPTGTVGVVVIEICLQQPICDDVMLICINLLTFNAVIYSYKTIFLFIFSAQICVLKHQNTLAPGRRALPPPQTPPPRRLRRLDTRRLWRLEFLLLPTFKTMAPPLFPVGMELRKMSSFVAPSYSVKDIKAKRHQSVSVNSKRFGNGSEKIGMGVF